MKTPSSAHGNVVHLKSARSRRLNLSSMAQARFAAERQASGLSSKAFADLLSDLLGWPVTPEAVSAWESASVPPGDVLLAADLAAGHQLAGIETSDLLAIVTPSLSADALAGLWLTAYQFGSDQSREEVKVHVDIAHIATTKSDRDVVAHNYPPEPRTESRALPFRNEIRAQLAGRHLVGTWKNSNDARYFGSLHLAVLPGETIMDGYYTGLSSDIEVSLGRWKWIRLDPSSTSNVDLEKATMRDPREIHSLVVGHTRYDRTLSLTDVVEGA